MVASIFEDFEPPSKNFLATPLPQHFPKITYIIKILRLKSSALQ